MAGENEAVSMGDLAGLLVTPDKGDTSKPAAKVVSQVAKQPVAAAKTTDEDVDWDADPDNSDEEIDGGHADDDEGDDEAGDKAGSEEGEPEKETVDPTEPLYTITVDGKQEQVTLKEALAGYQRTKDYTRKTEEAANKRKAAEGELEILQKARTGYEGVLTRMLEKLGPEDGEKTPEQWAELRRNDEADYAVQWADFQRRQEARTSIKAEQERVGKEKHAEHVAKLNEIVSGERVKLLEALPEWKDPEKYKAGATRAFAFAKETYGFTDQEISQTYDSRIVRMLEDARRYRAIVAKRANAVKQLQDAPEVPHPSARPKQVSRKTAVKADAQKRFNESGNIDDAVALLIG